MDRLTLLATHALSSAILGFALVQHGDVGIIVSALSGAVAFLCLRHLHDTMVFARDRRELEDDLNFMRAANLAVRGAHDDTRRKVTEITTALAKRLQAHEKKIASELQHFERTLTAGPSLAPVPTSEPSLSPVPAAPAAPVQARTLPDAAMLDLIRRSLEENRVDLYLQPIVTLPQRKVRFYEALTRLRSTDGSIVMPSQYMKVATPAGLMSVVDRQLLFRSIQVVRRLTQRTRDIAVFCNISEQTLKDTESFSALVEYLRANRDLANQMVFEFAQDIVLQGGKVVEAGLKALHELGFRLSLDQVTALDCDFSRLRQQGFQFVKVKARTIISGMKQANAPVAAEDFNELLARGGIGLIVERIEDEKTVLQLLDFNIGYGQGFLFGEPKPIRDIGEIQNARTKDTSGASAARPPSGLEHRLAG